MLSIGIAFLHQVVKFAKASSGLSVAICVRAVFPLTFFPVMAQYAVQHLQADVERQHLVQYARAVHIVIKIAARMRIIKRGQKPFSGMPKGVCPKSCPRAIASIQVKIQIQHPANVARNARHKLNMQNTPRDVVVFVQRNTCVLSAYRLKYRQYKILSLSLGEAAAVYRFFFLPAHRAFIMLHRRTFHLLTFQIRAYRCLYLRIEFNVFLFSCSFILYSLIIP